MAALPYMPFYPADYFADAHHLTTVEHGAYFLLITTYWMRGEPLPDDDRKLSKFAKLSMSEWQDMREEISDFFDIEGGLWRHKRIDRDLLRVAEKVEQARNAGKASAKRRGNVRSADDELPLSGSDNGKATNQSQSQSQTFPNGKEHRVAVFDAWNAMAEDNDLPVARTMNDKRNTHLGKRISEHGSESIVAAIQRIPESDFLMGKGDRGWKANFDWLLQPSSMTKLIEGAYHGRTGKASGWLER